MPHITHSRELNFSIVAEVREHRVDFVAYDIIGWEMGVTPLWHRAGSDNLMDTTDRIDGASQYLHGEVKWDGCSNWYFDEQDRMMLHGCCKQDVKRFGDVMALCWDQASELLPTWNA